MVVQFNAEWLEVMMRQQKREPHHYQQRAVLQAAHYNQTHSTTP